MGPFASVNSRFKAWCTIGLIVVAPIWSSCGPSDTNRFDHRSQSQGNASQTSPQIPQIPVAVDAPLITKPSSSPALTSFHPGAVWRDTDGHVINAHGGGFYVEAGTYYWFGEQKGSDNVAREGVSLYTSTDLYNWRREGIALAVDTTNQNSDIGEGAVIERPEVIFNAKTKKYVMWFHLELKGQGYGSARAGVAVSDSVRGPYNFVESFRPISEMSRDQTLFVDSDGKAYQFTASEENQTMHINELSDDYLTPSGKFTRVFIGRSMEAPAVIKYNGLYRLIASGCTGWDPNAARQAVASNIMGPWQELDNPAQGPGASKTFQSQSTYILEATPGSGKLIYIGDRWNPDNLEDSRYLWLPLQLRGGQLTMTWHDEWDLSSILQ